MQRSEQLKVAIWEESRMQRSERRKVAIWEESKMQRSERNLKWSSKKNPKCNDPNNLKWPSEKSPEYNDPNNHLRRVHSAKIRSLLHMRNDFVTRTPPVWLSRTAVHICRTSVPSASWESAVLCCSTIDDGPHLFLCRCWSQFLVVVYVVAAEAGPLSLPKIYSYTLPVLGQTAINMYALYV